MKTFFEFKPEEGEGVKILVQRGIICSIFVDSSDCCAGNSSTVYFISRSYHPVHRTYRYPLNFLKIV